ncbi:transmembrane prolyl 4-hydroxylase-like [Strongylocentrotus purpuratus]|uniref:Transmembrane prolyl 4-hydroxylase n=1 Tax=Strongylocentrotus purpuratus TaxID=7668 RepID=A0A7M7T349_STRPU|nr:transmembrane prolyl 4-hydroxylase-like [Strongylocentrotus purpuratus]
MACNNVVIKTPLVLCFIAIIFMVAASSDDVTLDFIDVGAVTEDVRIDGDNVAVKEDALRDSVVEEEEEGEERLALHQLDPVEVGYVREVEVAPGRTVQLKTVATKPPAFEIFNLLTPDECDHLMKLGEDQGLHRSRTIASVFNVKYGLYAEDGVTLVYNVAEWNQTFNTFDLNEDGTIDYKELHRCLPVLKDRDVELSLAQVITLLTDLDLDADSNGVLDLNEFWAMMTRGLDDQVDQWLGRLQAGEIITDDKVKGQHRISEQAWLHFITSNDQLLRELPYRISALTGLHPDIVRSSESMQVARYYPGGYYHAHYDSVEINPRTSCIQSMMTLQNVSNLHPKGRICRYITIMTYLNDVEEGGETAFPYADNATYSAEVAIENEPTTTDLKNHCHDANMVIHPAKGKTVMWYNHLVDPETGWLGAQDKYSLHGGCKVKRGVKWIANNWIAVDDIYSQQMEFHKKYFAKHAVPGSKPALTVQSDRMETDAYTVDSSTGTKSSSEDIDIGSSETTNAASEKAKAQREGAGQDGEPQDGLVDGSRDTAAEPGGLKGEL